MFLYFIYISHYKAEKCTCMYKFYLKYSVCIKYNVDKLVVVSLEINMDVFA